ncbi:LOW QUALITY PROTEIN: sorting nexin-14-like [Aphomia sociella]
MMHHYQSFCASRINNVLGCETCGSKDCSRHNDVGASTEPWEGLQIHKQLDQAIEDFYNTILDNFINSWYSKITLQPFFVDELRHQLRYASACLLRRALKVDYSRVILERLLGCALQHYSVWAEHPTTGPNLVTTAHFSTTLHPAVYSRDAEMRYLRSLTNTLMPYLLNDHYAQNSVFRVLIREIFAGWVLLSLTDVLADPYILNTIIVLATGDETMAELPTTPNYQVEFLETFVRHNDTMYGQRGKLLRLDLELVVNDMDYFYAFMQYMKTTSHLHLLQFYKDIKLFQLQLLNPELEEGASAWALREALQQQARRLAAAAALPLPPALAAPAASLLQLLQPLQPLNSREGIKRLQTSRALFEAARQSHAILEKIMLPRFLHSEEFYNFFIGSRSPTGYHKKHVKPIKKPIIPLRAESIYGHVLDSFANSEAPEGDGVDKMDILKYLDAVAAEETLREHDLKTYKVVLTNVEAKLQFPPRRGTVRVFTLAVHRIEVGSSASLWTVERSEHDFHLLRSKLHEFHGDKLFVDLQLPSRRDNSPLETLRYKYEDFLQRLLQKSLLQTSELLHLFLTVDGDFSMVVQATTLNANSTDLANLYQSVTHKLRKEKGQHLESFLRNLLFSTDLERYQALKQGTAMTVEEALEAGEESSPEPACLPLPSPSPAPRRPRDVRGSRFGDNFGLPAATQRPRCVRSQQVPGLVGFTDCLMYLLTKVIKARELVVRVVGVLLRTAGVLPDVAARARLSTELHRLLSARRLAHLVRLGQGIIFGERGRERTSEATRARIATSARRRLAAPAAATALLGASLPTALQRGFDLIQNPHLNKQLVYNLLDLCIIELFPELGATGDNPWNEPKS